ncbi:MAG: hypothetical protein JO247_11145 [Chloroflexi bacterium]|nr:hypothetical protein [Chloroflexota bacterium]
MAGEREPRLVQLAKDGERAAFGELYERHGIRVFQYLAFQLGGDVERAQEMCEQVFLAVLRDLRRAPDQAPFSSWVYSLANQHLARAAHPRQQVPGAAVSV